MYSPSTNIPVRIVGTQPGTGHCPELEDDLPEAQWYQQGVRLSALEHQNLNQCVCVSVPVSIAYCPLFYQFSKESLNFKNQV